MSKDKLVKGTVAAALALGLTVGTPAAIAADVNMEKCGGVAKAGMNDCGTDMHACAGQSTTDGDAKEWVYVPSGTCDKLVNGSVIEE